MSETGHTDSFRDCPVCAFTPQDMADDRRVYSRKRMEHDVALRVAAQPTPLNTERDRLSPFPVARFSAEVSLWDGHRQVGDTLLITMGETVTGDLVNDEDITWGPLPALPPHARVVAGGVEVPEHRLHADPIPFPGVRGPFTLTAKRWNLRLPADVIHVDGEANMVPGSAYASADEPPTEGPSECESCGALVANMLRHENWHEAHR